MDIDGYGNGVWWNGQVESPIEFDSSLGNFSDHLKGKMKPDSEICLYGCNTARELPWDKENIAWKLSLELPNVWVTGYKGFAVGNELQGGWKTRPFVRFGDTTRNIGFKRTYRNGEKHEKSR